MNPISFLTGISVATFLASGLFFFKFWKASRDRFFLFFFSAFLLIALERFADLFIPALQNPLRTPATEDAAWIYLIRLLAFALILIAIIDKNRTSSRR